MTDEREPVSDPLQKKPGDAGFMEELRSVLSNLKPTSTPEPKEEIAPEVSDSEVPSDSDASLTMGRTEEEPDFQVPSPSSKPAPSNSESDFWKGDVLGWSDQSEPDPKPEPISEPELPPTEPAEPPMEKAPEPAPALGLPLDVEELPQPAAAAPMIFEEPDESLLPDVPKAPTEDDEFAIPIPGTMDEKPKAVPLEKKFDVDDFAELEAKPEGLVQIACIFPMGQEKSGQQFVTKIREFGEKAKKPISIQAVFVQPWSPENVDVEAWKKSAVLSGADAIFIIAAKSEMELFKVRKTIVEGKSVKCRIVQLEQIALPTLYADIVVELQRKA